jgi:hypothetical protein
MRTFDFNFQGQTFQAIFRQGHIFYRRDDIASYFQIEPSDAPLEVTAEQGQDILPEQKLDQFRDWHAKAQNTLFELIRVENEVD